MIELLFLSGADVDELALTNEEVLAAVEDACVRRARRPSSSSRVPDTSIRRTAFNGHFNLLRVYVAPLDVAGVKVVGGYGGKSTRPPVELGLLTLYDPRTGVPRAILDATELTERRTGR